MAFSAIRLRQGYNWIDINNSDITTAGGSGGDPCGITHNTGNSKPHNNIPPYLAVFIWKRTS